MFRSLGMSVMGFAPMDIVQDCRLPLSGRDVCKSVAYALWKVCRLRYLLDRQFNDASLLINDLLAENQLAGLAPLRGAVLHTTTLCRFSRFNMVC